MTFKEIIESTENRTTNEYFEFLKENDISLKIEFSMYGFSSIRDVDDRRLSQENFSYLYDKDGNFIKISIPCCYIYEEEIKYVILNKIKEIKKGN